MRSVFITATDTNAGKTIVTGLLARYLLGRGHSVTTQKWIQTGSKEISGDIRQHFKLMGISLNNAKRFLPYISPYVFKFSASPHLSAKLENKAISKEKIKKSFKFLQKKFDHVVVEGVGGALVPYNNKNLVIDIAKELNIPAIIVVGNKLGAINHALLTIEALKKRNIKILGLIFNNIDKKANKTILNDNKKIVKSLTGVKILGSLPYIKNIKELYKNRNTKCEIRNKSEIRNLNFLNNIFNF
jgi:dethiobiotin synthetase